MIRILQVVAQQPVGGVGTFLIGLKSNMNSQEFTLDFLEASDTVSGDFNAQVSDQYSMVYRLPEMKIKNIINYIRKVKIFYKNNAINYDIVHVHAPNIALFHLYYAKKYGVKIRIIHAHSTKYSTTRIKSVVNELLIKIGINYATNFWGASSKAVKFMYPKGKKTKIIPNGVNLTKFKFDRTNRQVIRDKYDLDDNDFLVGCVGNLLKHKNYDYLLDVFIKLKKYNNIKLMIIGSGNQEQKLKEFKVENKLNNIIFVERTATPELFYSSFDLFVMCSKFEGFGYTALEAQANGLDCLFSRGVPEDVDISKKNKFIDINESDKERWSKIIIDCFYKKNKKFYSERVNRFLEINKSIYSINNSIKIIEEDYRSLTRDNL